MRQQREELKSRIRRLFSEARHLLEELENRELTEQEERKKRTRINELLSEEIPQARTAYCELQ